MSNSPIVIRAVAGLGLICSILLSIGLLMFTVNNLYFAILFGPFNLIISFYLITHYLQNIFYKSLKIDNHHKYIKNYWHSNKSFPTIDIFLPYCGEDLKTAKRTWKAALRITYPHKNIYILDDKGSTQVEYIVKKLGCQYISRPNKGYLKKSGNIRYALDRTKGDYIVIFDADFVPNKNFLKETVPYLEDQKIGILQTPQYFGVDNKNRSFTEIQYGSAYLQEDFYKIIQQSRNTTKSPFCVGTSVIYNRKALNRAGGMAKVTYCEDLETGFNIMSNGYYIKYLPVILSQGDSPDNIQAYFKQHYRWCYSSLKLIFSKKFYKTPITFRQRFSYFTNILYYIAEASSMIAIFQIPLSFLIESKIPTIDYSYYFLPFCIYIFLIAPIFRINALNLGVFISAILQAYTYLYTIISMLMGKSMNWIPTNTIQGKISKDYKGFLYLSTIIFGLNISLICLIVTQHIFLPINTLGLLWLIFYITINFRLLILNIRYIQSLKNNSLHLPVKFSSLLTK